MELSVVADPTTTNQRMPRTEDQQTFVVGGSFIFSNAFSTVMHQEGMTMHVNGREAW